MSKSIKFKLSQQQQRIQEKSELLNSVTTSEELFDMLREKIDTLSNDQHSFNLSVGDEYSFGIEYEVELIMELISDLRWFTRYNRVDDDESITEFGLDYLRSYFND